ncbi:hypothetical protein PENANT_c007G01493 [Penicillium antarcticum]|uniref:Major facilitator superfamily (MFS) profile domain-containing protein n=1 Tax=Penicillium antarcticum TaxID=416450 RepID=A0A1V6QC67_9EURO|nr:hypothetical protein PENANT_c007G01493 [Penicillium antarcticum]
MCMCLAAPTNFAGFAAVRFLLGFSEGAVSPAFVTITSIWYRKKEHNVRTALWITMNDLAQVIECFLMYGIGKNTLLSIAPWRVIFIICGAITFLAGVGFFILMPNGPKDAWFLNDHEREVLSLRMAEGREGGDKTSFSMAQLRDTHGPEGVGCILVWCFGLYAISCLDFCDSSVRSVNNLRRLLALPRR